MTRKSLLVALGVGLAGAILLALTLLLCSKPKSRFRERFERIQVGMMADEVHAIMGRHFGRVGSDGEEYSGYLEGYEYEEGIIHFADGRVTRKTWTDENDWVKPTWQEEILDSIRERFGR